MSVNIAERPNFEKELFTLINGERDGLVVEPRTPEREVGGSIPTRRVVSLSKDTFTQKYW